MPAPASVNGNYSPPQTSPPHPFARSHFLKWKASPEPCGRRREETLTIGAGKTLLLTLAVLLILLLAGCGGPPITSEGVELVLSSTEPKSTMTFELRFESALIPESQVGPADTNSPLVFTPPLAGTFMWLSPRSGVFTPAGPPTLDTQYQLSLRPGLRRADGQPAAAKLRQTLRTPPFGLSEDSPREASGNADREPEIRLVFNADVRAGEAKPFLHFRSRFWHRIPAEVRQGTVAEAPWNARATWAQEFATSRAGENRAPESPTNTLGNLLIVTPSRPLPRGKGWKLVLDPGLPAADHARRTRQRAEVPVGDVIPFTVTGVTAQHTLRSGPSIRVAFSKLASDLMTNSLADRIAITPAPADLQVAFSPWELALSGAFRGGTTYTVRLQPGWESSDSFRLTGSNLFQVKMPPIPPRLYFPACARDQLAGGRRSFPLVAVNVPDLRLRAKLLDPQTAIHALRGYDSYFASWNERCASGSYDEPYRAIDFNLIPGRTVFDQEIQRPLEPDQAQTFDPGWDRILSGRKTGVVFLDARRVKLNSEEPELGSQALIQLTDLGLLWKKTPRQVDVFVFSHTTGEPVPGATARLYSSENETLAEGVTDTNGLACLATSNSAPWAAVQLGDDFHAVSMDYNQARAYDCELPFGSFYDPENPRRVLLISDRNLYRPGEALRLKAIARDWGERGLEVPAGLTGTLKCSDARGRQFFQTNAVFGASGSWSVLVPLPTTSRGTFSARLELDGRFYYHVVEVQDFQPNAFEIALPCPAEFAAGESLRLPLSARYLFGQPLSRAQVNWTLEAAATDFQTPAFASFTFGRSESEYRYGPGRSSVTLTGRGVLTSSGNFIIAPDLPVNPAAPRPRSATLLAEVTDLNQQTLTRQVEFVRHSSDFYLGLRQTSAVLATNSALPIEAVSVRADGQPWPETVSARLTLQRLDWITTRLQGAGRTARYHGDTIPTNVFEAIVDVPPLQPSAGPDGEIRGSPLATLPPLPAGQYVLEARAADAAGRLVVSSLEFVVSAPAELGWNYRNGVELALKPDRKSYAPGQTAEVLVEAPFSGTALVTVEREKVLRSFVARLEGNAPSIRIPLEPGDAPNIFVSVTLVRGARNSPQSIAEPEFRSGTCELTVTNVQPRLAVKVQPARTNCLPGETVEVEVEVTDAGRQAVAGAEVLLYAVDDGILGLGGYTLPDPCGFFFAPRLLSVRSGISLPNLLAEDPAELCLENKGYLGGGGGDAPNRVRRNFLACAFWNAALSTDAAGRAHASFTAPDSLTRYRVFAVVHTADSRFGSSQAAFQVSKPLTLDPALPQFANVTDQLVARAVIHNQTAAAGEVDVTLELDGRAAPRGPGTNLARRISVPANGSAAVEFPVEFTDAGESSWVWIARFADPAAGGFTDAVQSAIEVGHIAPLLREVLLGRVAGADGLQTLDAGLRTQSNLLACANPQLLAGRGTLTVRVANTRVNELGESAAQLLHYPYGCAEQTASSLLPWIVMREVPGWLPPPRRGTNEVEKAIRAGVARLFSMQTRSGGLGYWPRADEPLLWASAYGGLVLALARQRGVEVPGEELDALLNYLSQQLRSTGTEAPGLSDGCLALYALAVAGRAEAAYHEKYFARRQELGAEDRALLALAIAEGRGPDRMIGELLRPRSSARRFDESRFGCLSREQAIRLLAWSRHRPGDPILDRLVDDLMREQKQAHWGTTQANAWALLALTDYARRVEGTLQPAEGRLQWGGESVPFRLDGRSNLFTRSFAFTNQDGAALILSNASASRLYTSVLIEARPPETPQPRQDRGFSLQRRYERLDDDNQPQDLRGLRVGDRVLVTLDLIVHEPARYVALDDALPAILEAVNPELKTQAARFAGRRAEAGNGWPGDFQEIRKDRFLTFADSVPEGSYTVRYVARVRAAGAVTAPSAKVEEMYNPERCGLSGSQPMSSESLP